MPGVVRPSAANDGAQAAFRKLGPALAGWIWPLEDVQVTSVFGSRRGTFHDGIDLRAALGTPVRAVADGKVIYSGSQIGGYGKMVVLKHAQGLASVYAHNSSLRVRVGQKVGRGQRIALSGNTGRSSGPHLHFEVRYGVLALDPLRVLPGTRGGKMLGSQPPSGIPKKVESRRSVASSD
jgi:murein DD-endopeptidase MepM/ murein hydrolase activator NlpD